MSKYLTPAERKLRKERNDQLRAEGKPVPRAGTYAAPTGPTEPSINYGRQAIELVKQVPTFAGGEVLTEKQLDAIMELVEYGNFGHHAAGAIGVPEFTWKTWMLKGRQGREPYVQLWNRYQKARAKAIVVLVARAKQATDAGIWQATFRMLESFAQDDWMKTERRVDDVGDSFKALLADVAELRKRKEQQSIVDTLGRVEPPKEIPSQVPAA